MSSLKYLEDIKNDLAQSVNIRTAEMSKYTVSVVVGDSGFDAGSRDVVKKILCDLNDKGRKDVVLIQTDDTKYKTEHTVVIVKCDNEEYVYKNININNTNLIFENII